MKKSLQIIIIGSTFLLYGVSYFGIISLANDRVTSSFWNIHQLTPLAHAEREDGEIDDDRKTPTTVIPKSETVVKNTHKNIPKIRAIDVTP